MQDEPKKYPLSKFSYPLKRVSFGKRQMPRLAEKAAEPRVLPPATIGHPKADLPVSVPPQQARGDGMNHASRSIWRKDRRALQRLHALTAGLETPPNARLARPLKDALGQDRFEDKAAAARSLERRSRII